MPGKQPLLLMGLQFSVQMVTSGVLAEMLARVYHEANGASAYVARPRPESGDNDGWHRPGWVQLV